MGEGGGGEGVTQIKEEKMTEVRALREAGGEISSYEESEFEGGILVAESRSGATQAFRLDDGRLYQLLYLRNGNIEVEWIDSIPENLTVLYDEEREVEWGEMRAERAEALRAEREGEAEWEEMRAELNTSRLGSEVVDSEEVD